MGNPLGVAVSGFGNVYDYVVDGKNQIPFLPKSPLDLLKLGVGQTVQATQPPKPAPKPTPTETVTPPTRDVQKANGAKGTQTSPGGGMPILTAAGAAQFLSDKGINPGAFSSIQLPGTANNPATGVQVDGQPFSGQETSVTKNTLGAFSATNGQPYPALDPSVFTTKLPEGLTSQFSQFGGMSLGNGAPTTATQGSKKEGEKGPSRIMEALNDTAGINSYMSKFGSPEQDRRRAADMAFLNADTAQEGLRAKQAAFGQFHMGGQTYQLDDTGKEFVKQNGKNRAMDRDAASSYRLGTSTAEQYKNSYKDAVKAEQAKAETPTATPKEAENIFAQTPAPATTAFPTNIPAGTFGPTTAELGDGIDFVKGFDMTPPMSSQQISDSFLNNREPLMRDPRK